MAWESTGTVSVTNGSRVVTGAGAGLHWINAKINPADALIISGQSPMEIESVDSATQITLRKPWLGATAAGVAYAIQPTRGFGADLATSFRAIEATQKGYVDTIFQGRFPAGSAAQPGVRFIGDDDTGLSNPAANVAAIVAGGVERARYSASEATLLTNVLVQTEGRLPIVSLFRPGYGVWTIGGKPDGTAEADGTAPLRLSFNGATYAAFNNSGQLGLGTSNPQAKFHVASGSTNPAVMRMSATLGGGGSFGRIEFFNDANFSSTPRSYIDSFRTANQNDGCIAFGTTTTTAGSPSTKMTLTAAGELDFTAGYCRIGYSLDTQSWAISGQPIASYGVTFGGGLNLGEGNPKTVVAGYGGLVLATANTPRATITQDGNLLIGVANGTNHIISKPVGEGALVLQVAGQAGGVTTEFYGVAQQGYNGAGGALFVGRNGATGRSINAGGTINANGADMAEYKRKAAGCGAIAKGDLCGVTTGNELTRTWGQSIDFVIKSWRPHTVGGDTWGHADSVTPDGERIGEKPVEPVEPAVPDLPEVEPLPAFVQADPGTFDEAEPASFGEPMPQVPEAPVLFDQPLPGVGASDEDVALWAERDSADRVARYRFLAAMQPVEQWQQRKAEAEAARQAWIERSAAHDAAVQAYAQARAAHDAAVADRDLQVETRAQTIADAQAAHDQWKLDHAQYLVDLAAWEARHEAARANVDRIAIAGQVPVNVDGDFAPGDFIVAMPSGSGIKAVAFSPADFVALDPIVQLRKVARVWGVTERCVETIDGEELEVWPAGLAWCAVSVG